ncbi:hypothetical protein F511_45156 [Dorcoceras hygrometricum]|uniref:Uncharacterized protein n=1 Tax=Dorcoceras hygrometricum TaxID=472368 RepID=A0A2Z6ZWK7_9LAMI|nr:hypothetical protein F511_45156 [Dorcoceras hygrometricum]
MAALNRALAAHFLFAGRRFCGVRGRAMEALVDVARAALRFARWCACCRRVFRGGGVAVAGRRSAAAPASFR